MKYHVDKKSGQSAFMQLYYQIRSDIINGVYKYGSRLPSKRLLAEETLTSVITVEHSYSILCDEGYVEARQRSGYFVTYRREDFAPVSEQEEIKPIKTETDETKSTDEEFPFSVFAGTMRNVIGKYAERILIKTPNTGCCELRRAISDYLARSKGINVDSGRIVVGSGSEYLYGLIVQLLGRERIYAIENPSYEKIHSVYSANGVDCDLLTLGRNGILSSELLRTKASVLHISPFRSFPSGVTANASKRNEYINWARVRDGYIIEDDFESEFSVSTKYEDTVFSLDPERSVIYVNTFNQTIAPSMRVGYMVLPESLMDAFEEKLGFYSCTVPAFEQYVIAEFIGNGDFERHINRVRKKRRKKLKEATDK